jgi:hypothetical protein
MAPHYVLSDLEIESFHTDGFVVLRQCYAPERVSQLRQAILPLKAQAPDSMRLSHLLHPESYSHVFAEWLAEDAGPHVEALVGGGAIRHSLFNLLGSTGEPYVQHFHRDVHPNQSKRPENHEDWLRFRNTIHGRTVQMNAPLLPGDSFFFVVPGSHNKLSTPAEVSAAIHSRTEPVAAQMPGAIQVQLEPGDAVYYDFTLWHRGHNPHGAERLTIHNAYWGADVPVLAHERGQADQLAETLSQHPNMPQRVRTYLERYIAVHPKDGEIAKRVDEHFMGGADWTTEPLDYDEPPKELNGGARL